MECYNKIEIPTFSGRTVVGEIKCVSCLQYNSSRIITILINGLYYDFDLFNLLYNRLKIFDGLNIGKYVSYSGEIFKIIGFDKYSIFNNDPRIFIRKKNEIETTYFSNCDIISQFSKKYIMVITAENIFYFDKVYKEKIIKLGDTFYKKNNDIELEEIEPVIKFKIKHLNRKRWRIKKCC